MAVSSGADSAVYPALDRARKPALAIGGAALLLSLAGALFGAGHFFRSYLVGFVFWNGIALGCLAILMLQYVTGGAWGLVIRRILESGTRTFPLMAILFLPLIFGLHDLYEWTHAETVAKDPLLLHKRPYLNVPFFLSRAAFYFTAWLAVAYFLNRWSLEQDKTADRKLSRRLQLLSAGGLALYALTVTFSSIDWVMSLEPHWFSTMYGVLFMTAQALAAFSFVIAAAVLLAGHKPLSDTLTAAHFHDLGKLLLAFVMLWSYVSFSQFLIIWAGNLPEEIPWYLARLRGGWGVVALALVLFHFLLPFLLLLSRATKRNPRALLLVAALVVCMRLVDVGWLILPVFARASFRIHWMDLTAPIGVGGIWIAVFLWQLKARPLLPRNDPHYSEAVGNGSR